MCETKVQRPPFKLEPYVASKLEKIPHILTNKTKYSVAKVSDWEFAQESLPCDHDPITTRNHFQSHYDHLGVQPVAPETIYKTTAQEMAEQAWRPPVKERNPNREMFNFYSYRNISPDKPVLPTPDIFVPDYVSTMQHSYRPQQDSAVLHRVAMPVMPWMLYRRIAVEEPRCSKHTFFDEDDGERTRAQQKYKGVLHVSFNPLTGLYTDGTVRGDPKPKCVQLKLQSYAE